jgi:hypothetical protein
MWFCFDPHTHAQTGTPPVCGFACVGAKSFKPIRCAWDRMRQLYACPGPAYVDGRAVPCPRGFTVARGNEWSAD